MPSVPARRPTPDARIICALRNGLRFMLRFVVATMALLASAGISYGLGLMIYEYQGRPDSWEQRERQTQVRIMLGSCRPSISMSEGRLFSELELEISEERFLRRAQRNAWENVASGVLKNDERGAVVYHLAQDGRVSRYHYYMDDFESNAMWRLVTMLNVGYGPAVAKAGPIDAKSGIYEAMVWRSDNSIFLLEFTPDYRQPFGETFYSVKISAISQLDPRYKSRWDTGGLLSVDQHAEEIRNQLAGITPTPVDPAPTKTSYTIRMVIPVDGSRTNAQPTQSNRNGPASDQE